METNLIFEGLKFMALGMSTVFLFLIVLIVLMNVMSKIIHKYFPEVEVSPTPKPQDNKKVIAAISAAITHHRNRA